MGFTAKYDTRCTECDDDIMEGDPIFFADGAKLCQGCADDAGYVCECGEYKKPEFDTCFDCHQHGGH